MAITPETPMAVAFFVSSAAVAWAGVFAWTRWLVRPQREPLAVQDQQYRLEQRLAGIEHAIQSMAGELERLGEGQRLTARMLADRPPDAAPRIAAGHRKVDTPH